MNWWTEDRVERLRKLWADGCSASVTAAALGDGCTRSAVIGKAQRLGLPGRATTVRHKETSILKPTRVYARQDLDIPRQSPRTIPRIEGDMMAKIPLPGVDLLDLAPASCKWPITDSLPHRFCAERRIEGKPYCARHCAIAYPTPPKRYHTPPALNREAA